MASQVTGHHRPSFAKVAAMPPGPRNYNTTNSYDAPHVGSEDHPTMTTMSDEADRTIVTEQNKWPDQSANDLSRAVQGLNISGEKDGVGESETVEIQTESPLKTDGTFDDIQTHLSASSTKPTSFDSKSMASVTTFAMDEKESLRPDDSASVQAIEEDESFSGSLSGAQNSQANSEAGTRPNQVPEIMRMPQPLRDMLGDGSSVGVVPRECASNAHDERQLHGFPDEPDEKLLEAMGSPKDRLLLLQLEDKIITFVKNASDQSLELPPCNAFGRLLAHKLGDYYHLTHFVDNNATSVRLHRTPWCRLPTPLSMLQPNTTQTPPPNMPAMKIMRRVGQTGERASAGGSTAPSSSAPSKATSEAGIEIEDAASSAAATPARDRAALSREEREVKYQEARERIFRDFPESKSSDSPKSGEQSSNISRSSSKAGRKKGHRQKTPHDDGFEARSQFNAYYYGGSYGQVPFNGMMNDGTFVPSTYAIGPGAGVNFGPAPTPAAAPVNAMYGTHGNMSNMPPYPMGSPALPTQNTWQGGNIQHVGYPPSQGPPMMATQNSPRQPANTSSYGQYSLQSSQPWGQPQYQGTCHNNIPGAQRNSTQQWPSVPPHTGQIPYAYGQSPHQNFVQVTTANSGQHLSPGSFARATFNPQSRSFAPGGNSPQRHTENGNPPVWKENANSLPRNAATSQSIKARNTAYAPPNPGGSHAGQVDHNSISKWGTPSHLPAKPPPSQVPYNFDAMGRVSNPTPTTYLPNNATVQPKTGPLVVSGATGRQKTQLQRGMTTGM